MVELGTGWYLRGDIGYSSVAVPFGNPPASLNDATAPPSAQSMFGPGTTHYGAMNATLGAGYQFNNWFRMDATFDWRNENNETLNTYGQNCAIDVPATTATTIVNGSPVTVTVPAYVNYANNACYKTDTTQLQSWSALMNAYGDLGTWFGLTPYIGAGIGITHVQTSANEMWYWDDGQGNYGGAGVNSYYSNVLNGVIHYGYPGNIGPLQMRNNFSWALMAGVSYEIAPHIKLDLGYRYLNMGSIGVETNTGATAHQTFDAQEARVGLRWTPDLQ